jgi:hypothetical protein
MTPFCVDKDVKKPLQEQAVGNRAVETMGKVDYIPLPIEDVLAFRWYEVIVRAFQIPVSYQHSFVAGI